MLPGLQSHLCICGAHASSPTSARVLVAPCPSTHTLMHVHGNHVSNKVAKSYQEKGPSGLLSTDSAGQRWGRQVCCSQGISQGDVEFDEHVSKDEKRKFEKIAAALVAKMPEDDDSGEEGG